MTTTQDGIPEPVVNIPLLRKAVEWVETQAALPDDGEWCQYLWRDYESERSCGTTYCVAGYLCAITDSEPKHQHMTPVVAGELLGINADYWDKPGHLFDSDNTAADVRRIAEELAGERL